MFFLRDQHVVLDQNSGISLTVNVDRSEYDSMQRCDCWQKQCRSEACTSKPRRAPPKNACSYQYIISAFEKKFSSENDPFLHFVLYSRGRTTYSILEPGPYCPDTGQAQITWIESLVSLIAVRNGGVMFVVVLCSMRLLQDLDGVERAGI